MRGANLVYQWERRMALAQMMLQLTKITLHTLQFERGPYKAMQEGKRWKES